MKFLVLLLLLCSCASIKSGKYISVKKNDTLKSLSQTFNVPTWMIKANNPNKKFIQGEVVFIPLDWGIMGDGFLSSFNSIGGKEYIWPVPNSKNISSTYGHRWGKKHEGIDIPARTGSHILSISDGVVVYSGNDLGGYGNIVVIGHRYGVFSVYAHNNKNYVSKGDKVYKGQVIAEVGSTGKSTGPHLHFEVRRKGRAMDPLYIVSKN
ncbi:MAG: M23 family metallopeptidase [Bdellovibrionales bacterium]|nr:M23 family metallopeptidase [Bdellovibrionales bacterium]